MEDLRERTLEFLSGSNGSGDGSGDGSGYGDGSGDGNGDGNGYGSGNGSGDGSGDGYGFKSINGELIWYVDGVRTIIREIRGDVAKGAIVNSDFTVTDCYIVKRDGKFAHGKTLHEAHESLMDKLFEEFTEEERVERFREAYPDFDARIPAKELFDWHNRLTGSCLMGRRAFAKDRGIDIDKDSFTVKEFVELTKNSYGGEIVRMILE